jgi:hypothetical protein
MALVLAAEGRGCEAREVAPTQGGPWPGPASGLVVYDGPASVTRVGINNNNNNNNNNRNHNNHRRAAGS